MAKTVSSWFWCIVFSFHFHSIELLLWLLVAIIYFIRSCRCTQYTGIEDPLHFKQRRIHMFKWSWTAWYHQQQREESTRAKPPFQSKCLLDHLFESNGEEDKYCSTLYSPGFFLTFFLSSSCLCFNALGSQVARMLWWWLFIFVCTMLWWVRCGSPTWLVLRLVFSSIALTSQSSAGWNLFIVDPPMHTLEKWDHDRHHPGPYTF